MVAGVIDIIDFLGPTLRAEEHILIPVAITHIP